MKCQRCLSDTESRFRVYTDELNIRVCAPCADEARRIGLPVETLGSKDGSLLPTAEHRITLQRRTTGSATFLIEDLAKILTKQAS
jgi:hypothetical protein